MSITPGSWVAASDFGWEVDEPNAVYAGPTERPNAPIVPKVASGITNPDDARLLASASDMASTLKEIKRHLEFIRSLMKDRYDPTSAIEVIATTLKKGGIE